MADKLKVIVDEILVTIKQVFDDKVVTRAQVAYWTIIAGNKLLSMHIGKRDSGQFLTTFTRIPVLTATSSSNPNIVKGRKYFELPGSIFDYDKDGGIEYICYYNDNDENCDPMFSRNTINRTTPGEAQWLYESRDARPSPKSPYWYRTGNIITILGIEQVPVKELEAGIYMTIDPLQKIDFNADFPFPQELMETLKRQVVDLARYSFLFPANDGANLGEDGAEESGKQPPKIISVNDQNNQVQ